MDIGEFRERLRCIFDAYIEGVIELQSELIGEAVSLLCRVPDTIDADIARSLYEFEVKRVQMALDLAATEAAASEIGARHGTE